MKTIYVLVNIVLSAIIAYVVFQYIPTVLSSSNTSEFLIGVGLILGGLAFIWVRLNEVFNDIKKG